jgi:hypothetical protein
MDTAKLAALQQSTSRLETLKSAMTDLEIRASDLYFMAVDVENPANRAQADKLFLDLRNASTSFYADVQALYPEIYGKLPATPPTTVDSVSKLRAALQPLQRQFNNEYIAELQEMKKIQEGD